MQYVLRSILLQNEMYSFFGDLGNSPELFELRMMQRIGLKYALMVLASAPVLAIFPVVQKYFAKGVMIGSIKG